MTSADRHSPQAPSAGSETLEAVVHRQSDAVQILDQPRRTGGPKHPAVANACAGDVWVQSRCLTTLRTLPSGARTKNRRTPQGSVVIGYTISKPTRWASS